jgi:hypothetical protein
MRGQTITAIGFWSLSIPANLAYAAFCVAPDYYIVLLLLVACGVVVFPLVGGLGIAWASLATQDGGTQRRSPARAWCAVVALTLMPAATILTYWPLRLAFFATKPTLERLADEVATGRALLVPRKVGLFRIRGSIVDSTGNVGLLIDPNPNGPTGLIRMRQRGDGPRPSSPFGGDNLTVELGGRWWYCQED